MTTPESTDRERALFVLESQVAIAWNRYRTGDLGAFDEWAKYAMELIELRKQTP